MAGGRWHLGVCTHVRQSSVGCSRLTFTEPGRSGHTEGGFVLLLAWVSVWLAALDTCCCQGASCTVLAWTTSALLPSRIS